MNQEEQLEELRAKKYALTQLMESDGWKLLNDFYQATKLSRRQTIFGHADKGLDDLIMLGQIKSELAGMDLMMSSPLYIFEENDLEEKALLQEMENESTTTTPTE